MHVTDPRFDADYGQPEKPARKRSKWTTCLIGCLAVAAVSIVLIVLAGVWVVRNLRGWAADGGAQAIEQGIDASDMPAAEKQDVKVQVDRVVDAFRQGRLSGEQLGRIMEKLADSPLMSMFIVSAIDTHYFAKSGLSDEEKAEGRKTLQRFVRGVIDGKIDQQAVDAVMAHIADRRPDGEWQLRNQVSDDELRAALQAAKLRADEAGIPEEPEVVDPSDEVKRIIDEAMAQP